MKEKTQALIMVPLIVSILTGVFTALSYLALYVFNIPTHFNLSLKIRALGLPLIVLGFLFACWLLKYRNPITFLVSTYETMRKAVKCESRISVSKRNEPLILQGPHRHVRHPIYFAAVVGLLGCWLLLDKTLIFLLAIFFFLWFSLVVIRFEELELKTLFGEDYTKYARKVPMFFPSLKPKWPAKNDMK